jgi:hypothetical protein
VLGNSYLDFIGLPAWYPQRGELALEVDDAILDAAESAVAEWSARDPLVDVALDGRWDPWMWAEHRLGDLPTGTLVRLGDWEGALAPVPDADRDWYPGQVEVHWRGGTDHPPARYRRLDDVLRARLPVPLDLAGALAVRATERAGAALPRTE